MTPYLLAEKVGTRAPLLAQALKRAHLAAATIPHRKGILTMHRTATIIAAIADVCHHGLRAHEERSS